ncbi:hypothetical protein BABINDRAFT_159842 [Babjeviella inositovora NRRL Y-12698]|uniref:Uncharacterized protein n=1 Tax=Babjeviella inositovora NRRL Y-12698 TaxID=984486 RepID=A0A1E3QX34_9ASCO|nr:uncharacterized protein BABINDRAFT_159842 [Babjeviella inositovora NRRL Y-12698]ODQ81567.1 hypothetical protein BABINDRAFT_159842 [Babjeviella inositovora NRRL Y-12698]
MSTTNSPEDTTSKWYKCSIYFPYVTSAIIAASIIPVFLPQLLLRPHSGELKPPDSHGRDPIGMSRPVNPTFYLLNIIVIFNALLSHNMQGFIQAYFPLPVFYGALGFQVLLMFILPFLSYSQLHLYLICSIVVMQFFTSICVYFFKHEALHKIIDALRLEYVLSHIPEYWDARDTDGSLSEPASPDTNMIMTAIQKNGNTQIKKCVLLLCLAKVNVVVYSFCSQVFSWELLNTFRWMNESSIQNSPSSVWWVLWGIMVGLHMVGIYFLVLGVSYPRLLKFTETENREGLRWLNITMGFMVLNDILLFGTTAYFH